MILVSKNVYKDVDLFENVFDVCKMFGNVCVCFENCKGICFESEQSTRNVSTYSKVFHSFPPFL